MSDTAATNQRERSKGGEVKDFFTSSISPCSIGRTLQILSRNHRSDTSQHSQPSSGLSLVNSDLSPA